MDSLDTILFVVLCVFVVAILIIILSEFIVEQDHDDQNLFDALPKNLDEKLDEKVEEKVEKPDVDNK